MPAITGFGEAMGELRSAGDGLYALAFAGDVFNTLAYVQALGGTAWQTNFVSAVGDDALSQQLLARCDALGIGHTVSVCNGGTLGLYLIETDAEGERQFRYWRAASPARRFVGLMTGHEDPAPDILFLSGITLAILDDPQRETLAKHLAASRDRGARVAFDPNYRAALWRDATAAAHWTSRFYRLSDIALPGLEDERELFGTVSAQAVLERPELADATEVVVKAGRDGVLGRIGDQHFNAPFIAPAMTVDTTAAGDAFNAGWLVARAAGMRASACAGFAARTAAAVASHPGAIIPPEHLPSLTEYMEKHE